ncbi:Crp/Fnr family transcriptional regulator [Lactiplantibacillus xiangfangensis]|uniref:Crp/Fnr family transcriptional regulator n=1 Tax=Lactiplantibacillus xiangfangensis TaxID=942150 RepID=UPI00070BF223|nr:Crp/Fnr family transcriptional regulator [Lactiplantibacillus xiangfangensis]
MTHSAFKCVQSASIFQGLSDDDITALAKISVHQQLFPKGTVLYAPTTLLDRMMIIDRGQVKVYQLNENGKEKILYMLRPGAIDSEAALFAQRPHYNYAETVEDTRICSIGSRDFQDLVKRVPTLALNLLNALGDRLTALESMSALTSNLGSKERLLTYLQQVSQENQQTHFRLPVKKKELASYLGVTPETLSRQFKLLVEDQLISVDGREITVY